MHKSDKEWFSQQIILNQDSMYRYAFTILKNDSDVKDVLQESIIKAYEKIDSLKEPKKFKCWILTIVKNSAYDFLRSHNDFSDIAEESIESPANESALVEKLDLYNAIQKLPLKDRTIVLLYYFEGMQIKAISNILEADSQTIRMRLSRARKKLKKIFEGYEEV